MNLFRNVVSIEYEAQAAYDARMYRDASLAHSRAVAIGRYLDQPSMLAVLCLRLGRSLKADHAMLDAAAAYEAGMQSFLATPRLGIEQMLVSLTTVGPYFYRFERMDMPDHDDEPTAEGLRSAAADPLLPAHLLSECAEVYQQQSSLYLALHTHKRTLTYLTTPETRELRAATLASMGALAYQQGELKTVETAVQELLDLCESTASTQSLCRILLALGTLYEALGNIQPAMAAYRQSLKLSLRGSDVVVTGTARGRLTRLATKQYSADRQLHGANTSRTLPTAPLIRLPLPANLEIMDSQKLRERVQGDPLYIDRGNF